MRAMVFEGVGRPLRMVERHPVPQPGPGQLLLQVRACGVCRTDLHLLDGEVPIAHPPRILGHQIVGTVLSGRRRWTDRASACRGSAGRAGNATTAAPDARTCAERARFTGRDIDGGIAEYAVADERYCFPIPDGYPDAQAAPLLCAGLIGYRALRMCGDAHGGSGSTGSAPRPTSSPRWHASRAARCIAFTRAGDAAAQALARELGAAWAGDSGRGAAASSWTRRSCSRRTARSCRAALQALAAGGTVVCGGIHMSDIPSFPYSCLWEERVVRSVANLTRRDGEEFLALAPHVPVRTRVTTYPLEAAAQALDDLRAGRFTGAAVIVP